jgi:hypothetical protein
MLLGFSMFANVVMPEAIYTAENCHVAYQLNWSVTLFANRTLPAQTGWFPALAKTTEVGGVRLLECRHEKERMVQFLVSTTPDISPSVCLRSVKGRLQHLLQGPSMFRRNYRIESVGEVNNRVLQTYVAGQVSRHSLADPRVARRLDALQYDGGVDLTAVRYSAHGQFLHNLHVVVENTGHLHDVRDDVLRARRDMLVAVCVKKGWLLSRIGIVSNHIHVLLGCSVAEAPGTIALSLLNNLAYIEGMIPVYEFGFYAGTFGNYDRDAIRRALLSKGEGGG